MAFQRAGADFRALQVLEDADSASFALGGAAQAKDVLSVIFVSAVREIQAGDVHAKTEQVAHDGFGVAGGADGADDFGAPGQGLAGGGICDRLWLAGFQPISSIRGSGTTLAFPATARETLQATFLRGLVGHSRTADRREFLAQHRARK